MTKKLLPLILVVLLLPTISVANIGEEQPPSVFTQALSALGWVSSSVIAGGGYVGDGAIYFVGGTAIFVASCGPAFAAAYFGGGYSPQLDCIEYKNFSFEKLEKNHPKWGKTIWRKTRNWRE